MCGICGIAGKRDEKLIIRMSEIIAHRGPDDSGFYHGEDISLGHRRLSIIDLESGHQPMANEDNSIWIVYNGEIYNYRSLREDLIEKGHQFKTRSDTEVIIHLYEDTGDKCVNELRGMFAFAIWDSKRKKLFAARDRLGIKPFYYFYQNEKLLFSSELKALLECDYIRREIDLNSLNKYLTFRYVPGHETIFKNVFKLKPGHALTFTGGDLRIKKYWDIPAEGKIYTENKNFQKKFLDLLEEAVGLHLISDVPLGVFLSGGLDSSSIVAMASNLAINPINTFTAVFPESAFNELDYARIVAEKFKANSHELEIKPASIDILPKIIWHLDEPIGDAASIPTYLLAKLAKEYVTVILTGEGGDEFLAGYPQYKIFAYSNFLYPFRIGGFIGHKIKNMSLKRNLGFINTINNRAEAYLNLMSVFTDEEKKDLLQPDIMSKISRSVREEIDPFFAPDRGLSFCEQAMLFDAKNWLPEDLLMKVDKMTMASAVEARVPLLDHKFIEYLVQLPLYMKLKRLTNKYVMRTAMKNILPDTIRKRKKQGFTVPVISWVKEDLNQTIRKILLNPEMKKNSLFNYAALEKIVNFHNKSPYYRRQMWTLFMFQLWYRVYIKKDFSM